MSLTAGGHPVHRLRVPAAAKNAADDERPPKVDPVPLIERYVDLARHIHKTAIAPRAERFIWGCSCGHIAQAPGPLERAELDARGHVLRMAEELFEQLEGHRHDAPAPEA